MLEHILNAIGLTEQDRSTWDAPHIEHHQGPPRGRWPIRPYSRSKYRPHSGSGETQRRLRQIARGMLQVSTETAQKGNQDADRQVNQNRRGVSRHRSH